MSERHPWTTAELANLRALWPRSPRPMIERWLAPHPWKTIRTKAVRLGLKRIRPRRSAGNTLIQELRARREAAGLSIRQLAKRMGYDQAAVGRWERGDTGPTLIQLQDWAEALDCRIVFGPLQTSAKPPLSTTSASDTAEIPASP